MRFGATAGPINPQMLTTRTQEPAQHYQCARFSKTSFATGIAENTLGHPT
jgi:hypothetical protein